MLQTVQFRKGYLTTNVMNDISKILNTLTGISHRCCHYHPIVMKRYLNCDNHVQPGSARINYGCISGLCQCHTVSMISMHRLRQSLLTTRSTLKTMLCYLTECSEHCAVLRKLSPPLAYKKPLDCKTRRPMHTIHVVPHSAGLIRA